MKLVRMFLLVALTTGMFALPMTATATDVDGPDDCQKPTEDFGDAPEIVLAYPGVPGRFPTCLAPSAPGTQTLGCAPISTPPGPTGFVRHLTFAAMAPYWLGCYTSPGGLLGIDREGEGKINSPSVGWSFCLPGATADCVESGFGLTFDQDECYGDGSDAGLLSMPVFTPCSPATVTFSMASCLVPRQVFLNILVDMNEDGDWNDNYICPDGTCAYEWAVKNSPLVLPGICGPVTSPAFPVGPKSPNGRGWMRITVSDTPVNDDFPWAGSATMPGGSLQNGETEDYPVAVQNHTDSKNRTWGQLKKIYR
ncbi:MAG: hypothetical protein HZB25_05925 [Candidatus Eisenbacteria bacterium]|nr:hypothetical protein [Candidatus Eisenbacteria bacterium]